jgi:hypothetical protein
MSSGLHLSVLPCIFPSNHNEYKLCMVHTSRLCPDSSCYWKCPPVGQSNCLESFLQPRQSWQHLSLQDMLCHCGFCRSSLRWGLVQLCVLGPAHTWPMENPHALSTSHAPQVCSTSDLRELRWPHHLQLGPGLLGHRVESRRQRVSGATQSICRASHLLQQQEERSKRMKTVKKSDQVHLPSLLP